MDNIGKKILALCAFLALTFVVTIGEEIPCKDMKLEPLGCFRDVMSNRTMSTQILNERDLASLANLYSQTFDWRKYGQFLHPFLCRCAEIARNKGYTVFGSQFYGECWSSADAAETYNKYGVTNTCINNLFEHILPNTTCPAGMGEGETNFVYRIADSSCKTAEYIPLGCHFDNITDRALPNYILNGRDPTVSNYIGNKNIDIWATWDTYLPDFICRCAEKAKARGDDLFATQFYGECWSGKKGSNNYAEFGTSDQCVGLGFKKCTCNDYRCIGKANTNYVYELVNKNSTEYKVEIL